MTLTVARLLGAFTLLIALLIIYHNVSQKTLIRDSVAEKNFTVISAVFLLLIFGGITLFALKKST